MSNETFASGLAAVVSGVAAGTLTEAEAETEILSLTNALIGLSVSNPQLSSRVVDFLARIEGALIKSGPPLADEGRVGALAFSASERAFYGPKTASGWGEPSVVLDGDDAEIVSISVVMLAPGAAPEVINNGTTRRAELVFGIPRGEKGDKGDTGTLAVTEVLTGDPGTDVVIENIGTSQAAQLRITIPRGDKGDKGDRATIEISVINIIAADQPPAIRNVGDEFDAVFELDIPRGLTGTVLNSFKGVYDASTTYQAGDIVTLFGETFMVADGVTDLVGVTPVAEVPQWEVLLSSAGGGGAGIDVQPVISANFRPEADRAYPVDLRSGAIALTGLLDSPNQGDRVELYDVYRAASGTNTLTIPADAPLNGVAVDLIVSQVGFHIVLEYVSASYGYRVLTPGVEDPDELRRATVAKPSITSPANGATDILSDQTITGSAFSMEYGDDTHASTDWQRSQASDFSEIDLESLADASNLTSWQPAEEGWVTSTPYFVRHRYRSAGGSVSAWSDPVAFTTASAFLTDTSALTLIGLMSTEPSQARKVRIHDFHKGITDAGLWSKLGYLYVPKARDLQAARIRWTSSGGSVGSLGLYNNPIFTPDEHLAGDGVAAYATFDGRSDIQITTTYPSTWIFGIEQPVNNAYLMAVHRVISSQWNRLTFRVESNGRLVAGIFENVGLGDACPDDTGVAPGDLYVIQKTSATNVDFYKNGVFMGSVTQEDGGATGDQLRLFCLNQAGSNYTHSTIGVGLVGIGAPNQTMSPTQIADLNTLWQTYRSGMDGDY